MIGEQWRYGQMEALKAAVVHLALPPYGNEQEDPNKKIPMEMNKKMNAKETTVT